MSARFGGCYVPMDAAQMNFRDNLFSCIIDKGTLDAVLCAHDFETVSSDLIQEISRVLAVNGAFVEITLGAKAERLAFLNDRESFHWTLERTFDIGAEAGNATAFLFRKF
jgi:RAT1-interacting protein